MSFCLSASVYVLIILSGVCLLGTIPLFFELGCETAYPVAEGLTNSWMTWWNNVFGLVFLLVPLIPNIGESVFLVAADF